jgi:hypothetical protein
MIILALDLASEAWRPIPGLHGYEASSLGRIRSFWVRAVGGARGERKITSTPHIMLLRASKQGHLRLIIGQGRSRKMRSVHHLILEVFVGPRPDGLIGCHEDGNPQNNRLSNLRWDTHASNSADMLAHGRHDPHRGATQRTAKLSEKLVSEIRESAGRVSELQWAAEIGCSRSLIGKVRRGQAWGHVPA